MSKARFAFSIAVAALLVASPATGQLFNFPVTALAAGEPGADPAISVGAGWGRGLNDDSGKLNLYGAGGGVAMETVSFGVAGGYIPDFSGSGTDGELTLSGRVAYHLPIEAPVNLSVQTGIGWVNPGESVLAFPVGVAVSGSTEAGSVTVNPWAMPRVQFTRVGGTASSTDTDFGGAAGLTIVTESGFGIGLAGDLLVVDDGAGGNNSVFIFGAYALYALP